VKATGKKQLIIAGVVTEVCVAFPALSAIEEGYEVFVITDAPAPLTRLPAMLPGIACHRPACS
jgi:nicotinamidase-related amidase